MDVHHLFIFQQCITLYGGGKEVKYINQVAPKKRVKLCRILNNAIHAKVKIGRHLSSKFKVNIGLGQGDSIAPLLFNMVLEIANRRSKIETQRTIFKKMQLMMWLLWEEDYKILKKYLHHWSIEQIRWVWK